VVEPRRVGVVDIEASPPRGRRPLWVQPFDEYELVEIDASILAAYNEAHEEST
jgi:hypothetical protein